MEFLINDIIKVTDFSDIESDENNRDNIDISDEPSLFEEKIMDAADIFLNIFF